MMRVPLQTTPNQTLAVTLARQPAQIAVRENGGNLYFDLSVNGRYIVRTRICRDRVRLLLNAAYRGFKGDFAFVDTQGVSDPQFSGLGPTAAARYQLIYYAVGE
jgi:hypothetical protein